MNKILACLREHAPEYLAETWDPVGWYGLPSFVAQKPKALITHDLSRGAILEAKRSKCSVIVTHHPPVFPKGKPWSESPLLLEALDKGLGVYACHTNFDKAALEVNQFVADGLGFRPQGRFLSKDSSSLLKLVTFVPRSHISRVKQSVFEAGGGHIGKYDFCGFELEGKGSYRPLEGANPYKGKKNKIESVEEVRFETVVPSESKANVLKALLRAHPYEEVAHDWFELHWTKEVGGYLKGVGYGVFGELIMPRDFSELVRSVKNTFQVKHCIATRSKIPRKKISKVGYLAGSGKSLMSSVLASQIEFLIVGEVGFHGAHEMSQFGIDVLELGHVQSEYFFPKTVASWLNEASIVSEIYENSVQVIGF